MGHSLQRMPFLLRLGLSLVAPLYLALRAGLVLAEPSSRVASKAEGKVALSWQESGWDAEEGCPTRQDFEQRVRAWTEHARWAPADPSSPLTEIWRLRLELRPSAGTGRMSLLGVSEVEAVRDVHSFDCDELASALAFVLALTLDPNLSSSIPERNALPVASESPRVRGSPERPVPTSDVLQASRARSDSMSPRVETPAPPPATVERSASPRKAVLSRAWTLGAGAAALSGLAPNSELGLDLQIHGGLVLPPPSWGHWLASAQLELSLHLASASFTESGVAVRNRAWSGELDVCPGRLVMGASAWALFCADAAWGRFYSEASQLGLATPQDTQWGTLGAEVRLQWAQPGTSGVLATFVLGLKRNLSTPSLSYVSAAQTLVELHSVPIWSGVLGFRLAFFRFL